MTSEVRDCLRVPRGPDGLSGGLLAGSEVVYACRPIYDGFDESDNGSVSRVSYYKSSDCGVTGSVDFEIAAALIVPVVCSEAGCVSHDTYGCCSCFCFGILSFVEVYADRYIYEAPKGCVSIVRW